MKVHNPYFEICKNAKILSKEEQLVLCQKFFSLIDKYKIQLFCYDKTRKWLLESWVFVNSPEKQSSAARLSRKYNTSVTGLNRKLIKSINLHMRRCVKELSDNKFTSALLHFLAADIHPKVLINNEVNSLVKGQPLIVETLEDIGRTKDELLSCVIKIGVEIAIEKIVKYNIKDTDDIFQESIIAIMDSMYIYDLNANTKWSSYVKYRVDNHLQKHINELISEPEFDEIEKSNIEAEEHKDKIPLLKEIKQILSEEEFFVISSRYGIGKPRHIISNVADLYLEKFGKKLSRNRFKELEESSLKKIREKEGFAENFKPFLETV